MTASEEWLCVANLAHCGFVCNIITWVSLLMAFGVWFGDDGEALQAVTYCGVYVAMTILNLILGLFAPRYGLPSCYAHLMVNAAVTCACMWAAWAHDTEVPSGVNVIFLIIPCYALIMAQDAIESF